MTTNPALEAIAFLYGDWIGEVSNAAFLADADAKAEMPVSFEWLAGGAALMMRQGERPPSPPSATWIIGRDEATADFAVLYNDARGVSRVYEMSFADRTWKMWRTNLTFSQRFEGALSRDASEIDAHWEKSTDGGKTWHHDFDMTFRRRSL
jgi:hypothetical protein